MKRPLVFIYREDLSVWRQVPRVPTSVPTIRDIGSVYTGPTEYVVGRIFGHLGVAFTRGRLIDLTLGHLGVQIFGRLGKRPSLEPERPSSRTAFCKRI